MTVSQLPNEPNDEDRLDLEAYEKALEEYEKDPMTFSLEEVEKELGL